MKIHIVKKGDTLYEISKKYNVELSKLIAANPQIADPDNIDVGVKVKIPTAVKPLPNPPVEYVHKHVVVQGDTLWKLSKAWNLPLKTVIDANPHIKNPSVLLTGDIVYIPKTNPDGTIVGGNPHNVNVELPHGKKKTAPKEELLAPILPEPVAPEIPVNPVVPVVPEPVKPEEPIKAEEPVKAEEPEKVPEKPVEAEKPIEAEPIAKPEVSKEAEKGEPLPFYQLPTYEKKESLKPEAEAPYTEAKKDEPPQPATIHSGYDPYQPYSYPLQTPQTEAYPQLQQPFAQYNVPASEVSAQPPSQPSVQLPLPQLTQQPVQPSVQTTGEIQSLPSTSPYSWQDGQLPQIPGVPGSYADYPGVPGQYAAQAPLGFPYPSPVTPAGHYGYGGCGCGGSGVTSGLPYAVNPWENNIPTAPGAGAGQAPLYGDISTSSAGLGQVSPYGTPSAAGTDLGQVSPFGTPSVPGAGIGEFSPYGAPSVPGAGLGQVSPYGALSVPGAGIGQVSPYGAPSVPGAGVGQVPPYGAPYGFQPGTSAQAYVPGGYVYHPYPLGATSESLKTYSTPYGLYGAGTLPGQSEDDGDRDGQNEQVAIQSGDAERQEPANAVRKSSSRSAKGKGKTTQKAILHAIASKLKERPEKQDPKENLPWINV